MKTTEHGIEDSKDVENVYHMRLMALLKELVRDKGFKSAARVLEIDQRTVAESAKTGQLSRRVRQALERALQEGVGSAAARQRERNEKLENRVEALEKGHEALEKGHDSLGKRGAQSSGRRRGPGRSPASGWRTGDRGRSCRRRSLPGGSGRLGEECVGHGQEAASETQVAAGVPRPRDP